MDRESYSGYDNPSLELDTVRTQPLEKQDTSLNPAQIDVGLRPRLCHLRKWADFAGYGFDLQSEKGTTGQYIGRVDYGSPAMVTGLRSGDHIVEVNGQNVEHASHADVVRRVMSRPAEVSMLLVDDLTAKLHEKKGIPLDGNLESILELHCPEEKPDMTKYQAAHENGAMPNGKNKEEKEEDKKEKEKQKTVPALKVFRFASCRQVLLMVAGTICALAHGAGLPMLMVVFGDMVDLFIDNAISHKDLDLINWEMYHTTKEEAVADSDELERILTAENKTYILDDIGLETVSQLMDEMSKFSIYYVIIACVVLVTAYGQVAFWLISAYEQGQKMRKELFTNMVRQNIGWFDTHEIGELNTRLADDVNKILSGIGDKIGNFFQWFSTAITGIVIGFVFGWKLTLVILAVGPLLALGGAIMTKMASAFTEKELAAYAKAGAVAEEVLSSIRTVAAFGGESKESVRYDANLKDAKSFGIRKGIANGLGIGFIYIVFFGAYALAFWYGSKLVREDDYTAGKMLIVFFAVVIGAFALGNAAPHLENFGVAQGAAYALWEIMDTVPYIDCLAETGLKPKEMVGNIQFTGVEFSYPSRKEVPILKGVDLQINRGQTVALVGSSGSGKSTVIQLIQRFYDTDGGSIVVDGNNVKDLNVRWLREHIGVVSQEPVLFATTIAENIKFGRADVSQAEMDQACIDAKAYDFIQKLPKKYETMVGERGAQLSGGQKQRIAIARALVRDPEILLLDEATSALDTESEASVQAALDTAREGRTTIVVAHRLSTIRTADVICGFKDGVIVESGSHDQLMAKADGVYHKLVTLQTTKKDGDEFDEVDLEEMTPGINRQISQKLALQRSISVKSDVEKEKIPEVALTRILKMNSSEWYLIIIGCIAACCSGAVQPLFAIIFAEVLSVFDEPIDEQESKSNFYSLMFLVLGGGAAISLSIQSYMFAISGENLTQRLRSLAFQAMLRQEIGYFDDEDNSTGALTTRLATETSEVQGATGSRLGMFCQSLASVGTGVAIGFIYSWQLTLCVLAFAPFIMVGGMIEMKILAGQTNENAKALEHAGKLGVEAISNIRTVASLSKERWFINAYMERTLEPHKKSVRSSHLNGMAFSSTQALIFFAYAAAFYLGSYLIEEQKLNFEDMMKVFMAIVFGAMATGQASSFAPNYKKARIAANKLFYLLDRHTEIDSSSTEGDQPPIVKGTLEFTDVQFSYPSRPTVPVLQGLQFSVSQGQMVALVGSSGCGKSTTVQLIERFYNPSQGRVLLDGHPVDALQLKWLRKQMGLVSQEPVLFDATIAENIAYGDNSRVVPMDDIIKAAKNANIHNFIASLPKGYDTNVGDKGAQLSGGQKQRVAIARALLRDPKILLLDEATSALDTESEKVVQDALDAAQQGRTSIVIAHRLSTIVNADRIYVFHHGKIVEAGTHSELITQKSIYYKLNQAQLKAK